MLLPDSGFQIAKEAAMLVNTPVATAKLAFELSNGCNDD